MAKQTHKPSHHKAPHPERPSPRADRCGHDAVYAEGGGRARVWVHCARPAGHAGAHAMVLDARHIAGTPEHKEWLDALEKTPDQGEASDQGDQGEASGAT